MTKDYTKSRATAEKLITKFGYAGLFTKESEGSGGFDEYGNPIEAASSGSGSGYWTDVNTWNEVSFDGGITYGTITPLLNYSLRDIDGEQILNTDGYVFFHSDVEPEIGSTTEIEGVTYSLVSIKKLDGNGVNVYRKLQLRQ